MYRAAEDITIDDDIETIKRKILSGAMAIIQENLVDIPAAVLGLAVDLLEKA